MTIPDIDHLTQQFYQCISFNPEHFPNFDKLQELFYGDGQIINNNFDKPIDFTAQSFAQALMAQIEAGNVVHFAQQELSDKTEVFGKVAQRISVYEYSFTNDEPNAWPRGVNYIQYIHADGKWMITSMVWHDESERFKIPGGYLS